ncbi:unnamed protein product [Acanthoscelides obtectus]|uniref:Enoyl reductase (ER) domain-containing protein n=1 Tax=Acanthoscelides obtectus TaxID=200917 RepID=A0A9P0JSK2_ACAOB|nr:unnamed protein product [Acanthoscelides obtectus]CAK1621886.1 Reticulon-4-interacting protein 1 homolog, mitochondrial [Acanthoscelides obtectus]
MLKNTLSFIRSSYSSTAFSVKEKLKAKAWQLHEYGDTSNLRLDYSRLPVIRKPNEVLVQVEAASVNPIDLYMLGGYGQTLFQIPRNFELEFPLILGRDFAGTVISTGHGVSKIKVGDPVYGFVPLHKPGSFAEVVLSDACHLQSRPKHLSPVQGASLVYSSMTAWSALFLFGNLLLKQKEGIRVLILGASGGVGTAAVQLLKSQNCVVYCTCAKDAVDLVYSLGSDCVFSYTDPDYEKNVELETRYNIILDCAKIGYDKIPATWQYDTYITLNSPLLTNTDKQGLLAGLAVSARDFVKSKIDSCQKGSQVKWRFFVPSADGFKFVHDLISKKRFIFN